MDLVLLIGMKVLQQRPAAAFRIRLAYKISKKGKRTTFCFCLSDAQKTIASIPTPGSTPLW
jgi:hypothetical protein